MATNKEAVAAATAITITTDSLAASMTVGRASTAVDNTTNLYFDALLGLVIVTTGTAQSNSKYLYVYGYAAMDSTPHYTDNITGTDAGFTRTDPPILPLIAAFNIGTISKTFYLGPVAVAPAFGGILPAKWGILVCSDIGTPLSTGTSANYQGVYSTSV